MSVPQPAPQTSAILILMNVLTYSQQKCQFEKALAYRTVFKNRARRCGCGVGNIGQVYGLHRLNCSGRPARAEAGLHNARLRSLH